MRATEFEFRNRFWFICLTYFVGFGCYWLDPQNTVVVLVPWIFVRRDPHLHSLVARHAIQALFAASAVLVTAAAWIRTWAGAYLGRSQGEWTMTMDNSRDNVWLPKEYRQLGTSSWGMVASNSREFTSYVKTGVKAKFWFEDVKTRIIYDLENPEPHK
jgi:hypothetical protein